MEKPPSPEPVTVYANPPSHHHQETFAGEMEYYSWFDEASIQDMNYFVKTITGIKSKGIRPDLIGSIIAHYASKWLPDLSGNVSAATVTPPPPTESVTASVMKKRFFVETLTGILPPEKDSVPCNFLLRLLRTAKMVGANQNYLTELENRVSWQLDQASLKELMIPSFSHTCGTLLDVELVTRLVKKFAGLDSEGVKTGAALVKVAKLVDSYLAEAAIDGGLTLPELISLAEALPSHARTTEDGLYRAIDTYLKRLGLGPSIRGSVGVEKMMNGEEEVGDNGEELEPRTPGNMKTRLVKGRTTPSSLSFQQSYFGLKILWTVFVVVFR
ncbi:hypothetical protein F2Q68_00003024 [Brassica cretica]|uniref:NPH3 domain-containing protein n=1 Tax=Brassica cretica TaxID=69181 RepID=A0A8S9JJ14_BRACR|nr:hypothetical protein F2Q68_00003024 [Brassica cretica]